MPKRLARATGGQGAAVSIVAPSGFGRSRMLSSFVLGAKIAGAAAIAVDATAIDANAFVVAGVLVERLFELLPMTIANATAIGVAPVIGHLSPAVHALLGKPTLRELSPFDRTPKLRAALVALVQAASRSQPLAIAVDDVHRADAASLSVLADLDEAASWLHGVSQGSPQSCMQYAQYLVDEGIARHFGGQWRLPENLRAHGLPGTLDAVLESRIARLHDDARTLALGLALARDESRSAWQPETHVRVEDLPKLIDGAEPARAFRALDELLRAGLVQQRDSWYVMGEQVVTDVLLRLASGDASDPPPRPRSGPSRRLGRDLDLDLQRDPDALPRSDPAFRSLSPGARTAAGRVPCGHGSPIAVR